MWGKRCLGRRGAVYSRTEFRNNRGGKALAAKQAVKMSEARDVLLKVSRSRNVRGERGANEEEGRGGGGGFTGHLLACGLQIYRCCTIARALCRTPLGAMRAVKQTDVEAHTQLRAGYRGHTQQNMQGVDF